MKWFFQFIDYAFYRLHRPDKTERLYNVVDIEVIFSAWNRIKYEYKITDKKILRIFENDLDDFIFKTDFYNFFALTNDIHDRLIEKYNYNTKRFEKKRLNNFRNTGRRFWVFDFIIKIFTK
jgi:hypothetical protein